MIRDNMTRTRKNTLQKRLLNGNSLLARRLRQNVQYFMLMAVFIVIGIALFTIKPGIGYQIVINGENIGYTKNPKQVENALASLDQDLRVAKGQDINYNLDVKFVKCKLGKNKLMNADDLKVIASSVIDVKKPAYLLKTDDGIAFAIDSKESMNVILDGIKSKYAEGKKNATAEIVSNVAMLPVSEVPVEKIYNYNQALSYMTSDIKDAKKPQFDVKVTYTDTANKPIKKGVTTISDSSMYEDESKVKSEGSDGVKSVESKITEINGNVTATNVISEKVIKDAVDKVILVGTKPRIPDVLQIAYQYLGVPYVWGGTSPSGFDCSGFTQYVFARRGVYLPRTTYEQVNVGRRVSRSELRAGDLVHFPGHVGIYIGDGMMIHAPRPGKSVETASIDVRNFLFGTRVE